MTALFTLHSPAALRPALQRADSDTVFLLLDQAVALSLATHPDAELWRGRSVAVLERDVAQLGFGPALLSPDCWLVDMAGFVALTVTHHPIVAWF